MQQLNPRMLVIINSIQAMPRVLVNNSTNVMKLRRKYLSNWVVSIETIPFASHYYVSIPTKGENYCNGNV